MEYAKLTTICCSNNQRDVVQLQLTSRMRWPTCSRPSRAATLFLCTWQPQYHSFTSDKDSFRRRISQQQTTNTPTTLQWLQWIVNTWGPTTQWFVFPSVPNFHCSGTASLETRLKPLKWRRRYCDNFPETLLTSKQYRQIITKPKEDSCSRISVPLRRRCLCRCRRVGCLADCRRLRVLRCRASQSATWPTLFPVTTQQTQAICHQTTPHL